MSASARALETRSVVPAARVAPLLELRRYAVQPGRRADLVALFEREFVETQEDCGIELLGQFNDLDAPDQFVWLRAFPDPARRAEALQAFYGGPTWRAQRGAANAMLRDSGHVHQLRPCRPLGGLVVAPRAELQANPSGVVLAHLFALRSPDPADFIAFFERAWLPRLWDASVALEASYVTDPRPNPFPALPLRAGEPLFVVFGRHPDAAHSDQALARIQEALDWSPAFADATAAHLRCEREVLRLAPTPRSRLRA